jgi:hypothetical protein
VRTALGTPRTQNLAAIAGGATGTETMGASTLEAAGLKGALHVNDTPEKSVVGRRGLMTQLKKTWKPR